MQSSDAQVHARSTRMSPAENAYEVARSRLLEMFTGATMKMRNLGAGGVKHYDGPTLDDFARALDDVTTAGTLLWLDVAARELRDVWDEDRVRYTLFAASAPATDDDNDEETMS